jgi:hypothetical protein
LSKSSAREEAPVRDSNSTKHDVTRDGAITDTAGIMISETGKHSKDGTVGISEADKPNKHVPKGEDRLEAGEISQGEHREHREGAAEPGARNRVEECTREKEEEEMENTVIRRVGFVFLAYNVEFWWVVLVWNHARLDMFILE